MKTNVKGVNISLFTNVAVGATLLLAILFCFAMPIISLQVFAVICISQIPFYTLMSGIKYILENLEQK